MNASGSRSCCVIVQQRPSSCTYSNPTLPPLLCYSWGTEAQIGKKQDSVKVLSLVPTSTHPALG